MKDKYVDNEDAKSISNPTPKHQNGVIFGVKVTPMQHQNGVKITLNELVDTKFGVRCSFGVIFTRSF